MMMVVVVVVVLLLPLLLLLLRYMMDVFVMVVKVCLNKIKTIVIGKTRTFP